MSANDPADEIVIHRAGHQPANRLLLGVEDSYIDMELEFEVWDSPNSAGVVIDAIRCAKLALENNISGSLLAPSAYFMKSPPIQYHDDLAHDMVEQFFRETSIKRAVVETPAD